MAERRRERGELENEVMRILWSSEHPIDARQVQKAFSGQAPAYTTILTALDRLEQKGMIRRAGKDGRKLLFAAATTEDERTSEHMLTMLDKVADREATLLRFAGQLSPEDLSLLQKTVNQTPKQR